MELYITFDSKSRKEVFHFPNKIDDLKQKEFEIGELLLDFIELDLSEYEQKRLLVKENFKKPQEMMDKINTGKIDFVPGIDSYEVNNKDFEDIRRLCLWQLPFLIVNKHFYFDHISPNYYLDNYSIDELLNNRLNFCATQDILEEAIDFCLNMDCDDLLKELTIKQRFFIYSTINTNGVYLQYYQHATSGFLLQPRIDDELLGVFYDKSQIDEIGDMPYRTLNREMIEAVKKINPTLSENYTYHEIDDICYLEFMKMVQYDIGVRKCLNCGKYFINNKYKNALYCNRIPDGETKPCNIIAPRKNYATKLKENDIAGEYRKRYKKLFGRIKVAAVPKEEQARFDKWKEKAEPLRDEALSMDMNFEIFKSKLDEIEKIIRNSKHS